VKSFISNQLYDEVWDYVSNECFNVRSVLVITKKAIFGLCQLIRSILENYSGFNFIIFILLIKYLIFKLDLQIINSLDWWKRQIDFSSLFNSVKMILGISTSSAPSEKVFSTIGLLMNSTQNKLNPQLLEQMTILKLWLQKKQIQDPTELRNLIVSLLNSFYEFQNKNQKYNDDEIEIIEYESDFHNESNENDIESE
jgi:hypothetical protein